MVVVFYIIGSAYYAMALSCLISERQTKKRQSKKKVDH